MKNKMKGRSRRKKSLISSSTKQGIRRGLSLALCVSMIVAGIPNLSTLASVFADDETENMTEFSMTGEDLADAVKKAVAKDKTIDENKFRFLGDAKEEYESLFFEDGDLYEVFPTVEENEGGNLFLRTFIRTDGSSDDEYEITGDEQVIFLLINGTDEEQSAVISVDDCDTEIITVAPAGEISVTTATPSSASASGTAVEETSPSEEESAEVEEDVYEKTDDTQGAEDSYESDKPEPEEGYEAGSDANVEEDSLAEAPDESDYGDDVSDSDEDTGEGSGENVDPDNSDNGHEDVADVDPDDDNNEEEADASERDDDTQEYTASISVHKTNILTASVATPSEVEITEISSDGSGTIDGVVYEAVRLGSRSAAAYVTMAADLGLDGYAFMLTYEGPDYTVTVRYNEEAELPEGAMLTGEEYDTRSETYIERYEEAKEFYGWEDGSEPKARLFDVSIWSDDEAVEPASEVEVIFSFFDDNNDILTFSASKDDNETDDDNKTVKDSGKFRYKVAHFGEDKTEKINSKTTYEEGESKVTFTLGSFSDIMVLATNEDDEDTQYVILNIGNINGSWRDDSSNINRYTGYRPWATITGYNGANYDYYGNGTGTGSLVGYGGFADDWRITVAIPADYFDGDKITITLPCDDDLPESDWHDDRATFYIYGDENDEENAVSVLLPKENAYDYSWWAGSI